MSSKSNRNTRQATSDCIHNGLIASQVERCVKIIVSFSHGERGLLIFVISLPIAGDTLCKSPSKCSVVRANCKIESVVLCSLLQSSRPFVVVVVHEACLNDACLLHL